MLRDIQEETTVFLERVELLKEKLGPLLIQLPPNFSDEGYVSIRDFLQRLPKKHRYAIEIRNQEMFTAKLYSMLRTNSVTLAWVDRPNIPVNRERTGDFIYARWEGDRKKVIGTLGKTEIDRTTDTKCWVEELKPFFGKQIPFFGYFSKYYSGLPTSDAQEFLKSVNTY